MYTSNKTAFIFLIKTFKEGNKKQKTSSYAEAIRQTAASFLGAGRQQFGTGSLKGNSPLRRTGSEPEAMGLGEKWVSATG